MPSSYGSDSFPSLAPIQNELPALQQNHNNEHVRQPEILSVPSPAPPQFNFFQPPVLPPTDSDQSSPPFDFISSGQVTSIPSYDPFPISDENSAVNSNNTDQNKLNNHFLTEADIAKASQKNTFNSEATKTSSAVTSSEKTTSAKTNGGLFNTLFGKLRRKFFFVILNMR